MELVAFLGDDKENWGQVSGLINKGEWEKIILLGNKNTSSFPKLKNSEFLIIDTSKNLLELKSEIMSKLKGKFSEFEACLSLASGTGKEHMALISALLSLPVGIRLVAYTKKGIEFVN
jgi:hypothetical protein